jgi:hypothetical protein
VRLSSQTLGATVCEGVKYKVARMPSGSFRVSLRSNPEVGAVFLWQANFRWAVGEPKSAEEVDSHCVRLLEKSPPQVQSALFGS